MKSQLLMLTAAGILFAGAAHATDRNVEDYLNRATANAAAKANQAGIDLSTQSFAVEGRVSGDGRLEGVRVVRSSGSLETDAKAAQALRRLSVDSPPPGLVGRAITVNLGQGPIVQAKAR